ncbi:hypothetical protein JR316_0004200 [Psilocybe cubensis]|uniref:Uncharacterized protein n=2 Tax=Psilocybe cubensis TaxID=181762 RepID=A0ACB8H4I9_PSICU|nr:hypothetical protein JR316_0004200 [Psilocybe cubensis]KAH9482105.1 hypothetical protein JR316_0004200 [Psilocybe cubensis]
MSRCSALPSIRKESESESVFNDITILPDSIATVNDAASTSNPSDSRRMQVDDTRPLALESTPKLIIRQLYPKFPAPMSIEVCKESLLALGCPLGYYNLDLAAELSYIALRKWRKAHPEQDFCITCVKPSVPEFSPIYSSEKNRS